MGQDLEELEDRDEIRKDNTREFSLKSCLILMFKLIVFLISCSCS